MLKKKTCPTFSVFEQNKANIIRVDFEMRKKLAVDAC